MRGQAKDPTVFIRAALAVSKELDFEVRRARSDTARAKIEAIRADNKDVTHQFIVDLSFMSGMRLRGDERQVDRRAKIIVLYSSWRENADVALAAAKRVNQTESGL